MKTSVEIVVTSKLISPTGRMRCASCPIALAMRIAFPGLSAVIGPRTWELYGRAVSPVASGPLPVNVQRWIKEYDRTGKGAPMKFEISVPKELAHAHA